MDILRWRKEQLSFTNKVMRRTLSQVGVIVLL